MNTQEQENKALIGNVLMTLFGKKDVGAFDTYFEEPYIQHNPNLPDGIEASKQFLGGALANLKGDAKHIGAEGDLVYVHSKIDGFGPNPSEVVDIFRIEGGKVREHWDIMQDMGGNPDPDTAVAGVLSPIDGVEESERMSNKQIAEDFFAGLFGANKDVSVIDRFISEKGMVFHHAGEADSQVTGEQLKTIAENMWQAREGAVGAVVRSVADGDMVMLHVKMEQGGSNPVLAMAHLFRVQGGKVVEYWSVKQEVPASAQNSNTMF